MDDSFSEERFLPAGSWESLDSEGRPSSRPSSSTMRDRRKQFDVTTPTLVDEDEQEMVSWEQRTLEDEDDAFSSLRRTPGASMYKSAYEESMRRTPGATAMHRSEEQDAASLGFALTLSTPVAAAKTDRGWGSGEKINKSDSQEHKPPLARAPSRPQNEPAKGPFSFAPWTRAQTSTDRTRAFSPTTLRLREDLGNLLLDEDEDVTLEIPSRGDKNSGATTSEFSSEDWTGSYVFDSGHRKPGVPRNYPNQREGKSRRRAQGGFLSHAQQPKPRRSGNEGFEFGKTTRGDDRASPQLLNFGGAFAPPTNSGSFMRPVASSAVGGFNYESTSSFAPTQQQQLPPPQQQIFQFGMASNAAAPPGVVPSQSFETSQQPTPEGFYSGSQPPARYSPSPVFFVPAGSQPMPPPSEMQATAREFVPMARSTTPQFPTQQARSSTPQFPSQQARSATPQFPTQQARSATPQFPTQQARSSTPQFPTPQARSATPQFPAHQEWGPPGFYDPPAPVASLEQGSWHGGPAAHYIPPQSYPYAMQSQSFPDARAAMTPSPHLTGWQLSPQPDIYGGMHMSSHTEAQQQAQQQYARAAMTPTPTHSQQSSTSAEVRETPQRKRDTKRGKRGKKKSQKEKSDSSTSGKKTPTRRKGKGDLVRPGSTTQVQEGNIDEGAVSTSEDPVDAKRAELVESPATRVAFKEFYRSFRNEERLSFQKAEEFALQAIDSGSIPDAVHWRVYLELADLAKRSNRFAEARRLFQKACQLQPYAFQGWLEYSKLEEECGYLNRVMSILHTGLEYCEYNETLMTRAVKLQEKMGNLGMARALLARLKHVGIHKVWKTVLEGALVEARAGNVATARRVLKYLMHHVPWYGPLYLEAYRLERDQHHVQQALQVVERGLRAIPRYGPLWFGALRLCEEIDAGNQAFHLPATLAMIERATASISKELVWKVHLEAALMHERAALRRTTLDDPNFDALLNLARHRLALTILTCPNNLRWKVWLAAARSELGFGNTDRARSLFIRAHRVVPEKGRSATLLECARLEEFLGDTGFARAILCKGRRDYGHDWKVWLESVLLEIRDRKFARAIEICTAALEIHAGTGRLWACLVQLQQFGGDDRTQHVALRRALNAVPKSGEVWCEGGRIHLNPFSATFDLDRARRHLYFATKFTPQYGDSFVEGIRLEVVDQWLSPIADFIWEATSSSFQPIHGDETGNEKRLIEYVTDLARIIAIACKSGSESVSKTSEHGLKHRSIITNVRKWLRPSNLRTATDLSDLRLACANADPNYGSLWFCCRQGASDPPRKVIENAAEYVADDLQKYAHIYLSAMIRRKAILSMGELTRPSSFEGTVETSDPKVVEWEVRADEVLISFKTLGAMFQTVDPGTTLLNNEDMRVGGPLFVAGLSELNKHKPVSSMNLAERKRALFGNDALFP